MVDQAKAELEAAQSALDIALRAWEESVSVRVEEFSDTSVEPRRLAEQFERVRYASPSQPSSRSY
jgi:hypothetical protein